MKQILQKPPKGEQCNETFILLTTTSALLAASFIVFRPVKVKPQLLLRNNQVLLYMEHDGKKNKQKPVHFQLLLHSCYRLDQFAKSIQDISNSRFCHKLLIHLKSITNLLSFSNSTSFWDLPEPNCNSICRINVKKVQIACCFQQQSLMSSSVLLYMFSSKGLQIQDLHTSYFTFSISHQNANVNTASDYLKSRFVLAYVTNLFWTGQQLATHN